MNLVGVGKRELGLVVTHLGEAGDAELDQGGLELLHHVGPDLCLPVPALNLDNLEDPDMKMRRSMKSFLLIVNKVN